MPAETYIGTPCAAAGHTLRYVKSKGCVVCELARARAWRAENAEQDKELKRAYYKKHKHRAIAAAAKWRVENPQQTRMHADKKYGRCPQASEAARQAHDGTCAICGVGAPGGRGTWHVDHAHDGTGDVRGLLCHRCNTGIGSLRDSPVIIEKALAYVRRPAAYKRKA